MKAKFMFQFLVFLTLALLLASPCWAGTYKDDFSKGWFGKPPGLVDWGDTINGTENGIFIVKTIHPFPPDSPLFWFFGNPTWSRNWKDYTVEARIRLVSDDIDPDGWVAWGFGIRSGVMFGANQGYFFVIDFHEQTTLIRKFFPEQGVTVRENISRRPFKAEKDVWYKLKVVAEGNHFQFYINDKLVDEIDDDTLPEGPPALTVRNATVHYDWFVLTGEEIPDEDYTTGPLEGFHGESGEHSLNFQAVCRFPKACSKPRVSFVDSRWGRHLF